MDIRKKMSPVVKWIKRSGKYLIIVSVLTIVFVIVVSRINHEPEDNTIEIQYQSMASLESPKKIQLVLPEPVEDSDEIESTEEVFVSGHETEVVALADKIPEETVESTTEAVAEPVFNELGYQLLGTYSLTAYCPCTYCTGSGDGITASGTVATSNHTVACNSLAMGTVIYIEGLGTYVVEDRGGMGGNVIDIFFDDHDSALVFGRQSANVYLVQ